MKFWYYLVLIAAGLLLIGSFFLPSAVAGVMDARRLDNLEMIDMVDSQGISFNLLNGLTLTERLALVVNPDSDILPLKTGNAMDNDAAKDTVIQELEKLFLNSQFRFNFDRYSVEDIAAALIIDATVPTLNIIIWEFILTDDSGNTINVTLDDETGFILKVIYKLGNRDGFLVNSKLSNSLDDEFYSIARSLTEMLSEYYGVSVTLAAYQFNEKGNISYYKADLFSNGKIIPMYGAVRSYSFTINERVRNVE